MRSITNDDSDRDITTRSSNMKTEGGTILLSATNTFGADTVSAGTGTLEYDGTSNPHSSQPCLICRFVSGDLEILSDR